MYYLKSPLYVILAVIGILLYSCSVETDHFEPDKQQKSTNSLRDGTPCFDLDYNDCGLIVDEVDKIIDLPNYCQIKATYKIYRCPQSGITIYTLELISWDFTSDCYSFLYNNIISCYQNCQLDPDPYTCRIQCLSEAKRQLEMDLKRYIMDQYITTDDVPKMDAGDCGGQPIVLEGHFFEDLCIQLCVNSNADPGHQVIRKVCGDGCCTHIRYYCKDPGEEQPHFNFEVYYSSGLNCGSVIIQCDEGYELQGDCTPLNCHP